ncbi:MAG: hypothetical protein ACT4PT_05055, partial [Methanobacteriota archaeon]
SRRDTPRLVAIVGAAGVFLVVILYRWRFLDDPLNLYSRAHMLFFFYAAVLAGLALSRLRLAFAAGVAATRGLGRVRGAPLLASSTIALLLVAATTTQAVEWHIGTPFYFVVQADDVETYEWIAREVPARYDKTLMHPWKAPAYNAITGHRVYTVLYPGDPPVNQDAATAWLAGGGSDVRFLLRNGITMVVLTDNETFGEVPNMDRVRGGVYLLEARWLPFVGRVS